MVLEPISKLFEKYEALRTAGNRGCWRDERARASPTDPYVCQRGRSLRRACALLNVARSTARSESRLEARCADRCRDARVGGSVPALGCCKCSQSAMHSL